MAHSATRHRSSDLDSMVYFVHRHALLRRRTNSSSCWKRLVRSLPTPSHILSWRSRKRPIRRCWKSARHLPSGSVFAAVAVGGVQVLQNSLVDSDFWRPVGDKCPVPSYFYGVRVPRRCLQSGCNPAADRGTCEPQGGSQIAGSMSVRCSVVFRGRRHTQH